MMQNQTPSAFAIASSIDAVTEIWATASIGTAVFYHDRYIGTVDRKIDEFIDEQTR